MKARIRSRFVNADAGGNDLLMLGALFLGGYYFLTRQVIPDAARAVTSAGGAVADGANAAANKVAQILTGNPYASVGTAAYELLHPNDRAGAIATAPTYATGPAYDVGQNLVNNPDLFDRPAPAIPYTPGVYYDVNGDPVGYPGI